MLEGIPSKSYSLLSHQRRSGKITNQVAVSSAGKWTAKESTRRLTFRIRRNRLLHYLCEFGECERNEVTSPEKTTRHKWTEVLMNTSRKRFKALRTAGKWNCGQYGMSSRMSTMPSVRRSASVRIGEGRGSPERGSSGNLFNKNNK